MGNERYLSFWRISDAACVKLWVAAGLVFVAGISKAQTYAPPANGDYGGSGPYSVYVDGFTNPIYPTANGATLIVWVYHPNASISPSLPSIFVAHGYTSPIGDAADYSGLLTNLASWGYIVVFSPYEGGVSASIAKRFDELTTGFEAAVNRYGLNTAQVGFVGHSYGAGFLPAVIQHELMGKGDVFSEGHTWGGTSAFMFSMAPSYAYGGGGQTGVGGSLSIAFPTNLNVIEQVFKDDTSIADPRTAIDIFYCITTPNSQKEFLTVYGDDHGTPAQVASHFLPNSGSAQTSTSLQAWAIFRHVDALAAWTFAGDTSARQIALGNGAAAETYVGRWSDDVPVQPMGATDIPNPAGYAPGPYVAGWDGAANPRGNFVLVSGPPMISDVSVRAGQAILAVSGLIGGHTYAEQTSANLMPGSWSNAMSFVAAQSGQSLTTQSLTNALAGGSARYWRILVP
jgi:hypothetical protein